jgi:di/tricarboxylate transporter
MISTPLNAMAYGEGGLTVSDVLVPGLTLMLGGCVLLH